MVLVQSLLNSIKLLEKLEIKVLKNIVMKLKKESFHIIKTFIDLRSNKNE